MSKENLNQEAVEQTPCDCTKNDKINNPKQCCCKIRKVLLWISGVIVAVAALLLIFRDMYIPFVVSKAGSFALGTKVELKKFSSSLTGKVDIQGLTVANPEGYHNANAFELERIYVDLSILSIFSNEIIIREILVTGMKIDLESKLSHTNLGDIQKNVERLLPAKDISEDENTKEEKSKKSVVIEKLNINNNSISFSNSTLQVTVNIPLLPISMTDIGKGQSIAETLNEVLTHILTSVFNACSNLGGAVADSLSSAGSIISDSASSVGKSVTDSAKSIGKGISDTTKKIFSGF